jgi:hypothetical protein
MGKTQISPLAPVGRGQRYEVEARMEASVLMANMAVVVRLFHHLHTAV